MPNPTYPFTWNALGLRPPANSRRVETLVQGSNASMVSDLLPNSAFTETWPTVGVTTYGSVNFANAQLDVQGVQHFAGYVLQKTESEWRHPDFTRCYFAPVIPYTPGLPFKTTWGSKIQTWHAILEKIVFIPDYGLMVPIQTAGGVKYVPRYYVQWDYRPSLTDATKVREDWFLSTTPFDLTGFDFGVPQPGDVSWDLGPVGQSGSMGTCLHGKIKVKAADPNNGFNGGEYSESYPPTNVATWDDYPFDFETTSLQGVLYQGILRTAIAPPLPPITRKRF